MKKIIAFGYFLAFLLFNACSLQNPAEAGKIYDHISIKKDSSLSYALYLPSKKNTSGKLAFIFFDPHGSGELPVRLYKNLADKYGILLVGNNNSSNNTDMNLISTNFSSLLEDLKNTYKLEDKNISLWGFSGGAKVALYNAGLNNQIAYCIYGGSVSEIQNNNLELLGFNGKQDMNYTDLLGFASQQQSNPKHFQIEFSGKHAWPDTITAQNAFRWFLLKKMQHQELITDQDIIASTSAELKKETEENIRTNQLVDALLVCNRALHFLSGIADVSYFSAKQKEISSQVAFKKQVDALKSVFSMETQMKERYQSALFSRDTIYWKKEIEGLRERSKTDKTGMYDRLLGFLSLAGYSIANRAFQGNDLNAIQQILFIYQHADPGNPEQAFMRAKLYVLRNELDKARMALQESIQLGIDKNRIAGDILLKNL